MQFGHALCCVLCSALPPVVMEDLSIWMSSELCTACSVTAIIMCCSYAMLCAVCMQLDAGRALLCAAVIPRTSDSSVFGDAEYTPLLFFVKLSSILQEKLIRVYSALNTLW